MRNAQGPVVKGDFNLTGDNIDEYHQYAIDLDANVRWINSMISLQYKLDHIDEIDDDFYTEEYLKDRLEKLKTKGTFDETAEKVFKVKAELHDVNKEIDKVRPLVFDEVEGTKPENHERMSNLDDRRKELEEQLCQVYADKYPLLKQNLSKIFYMIVEGCDIDTVRSCFRNMRMVLVEGMSTEEAANNLMKESEYKYNLPKGIYDPIRKKIPTAQGKKKGKKHK